jgi:DNA mismatch repair protein MutL
MSDIIKLLPDALANQIAAGEVVQRPASAVKELMENAIDAGASNIKVIIRDGGKTLIQVIDDGKGMSDHDARMCFERHATSKIRFTEDLFSIKTMGFRGEAMASIAAVAQVELKTRLPENEVGTRVLIEGSKLNIQEPTQTPKGTNIQIKNLFFNIPARRNFLKAEAKEFNYIQEEFDRIAMANPQVFFSLHHNEEEKSHLPSGNLRQRIVGILGQSINPKLVPIRENTDTLNILGFIGKPEAGKKVKSEQYLFVNNRFIKSAYVHHAIMSAYEGLVPEKHQPPYMIFLEMDPSRIDVNVHPTKQEIKFEDERIVYNYVRVAVRHALGQNQITPVLDFESESAMRAYSGEFQQRKVDSPLGVQKENGGYSTSRTSPNFPPSGVLGQPSKREQHDLEEKNLKNWQKIFTDLDISFDIQEEEKIVQTTLDDSNLNQDSTHDKPGLTENKIKTHRAPYQIHNTYILTHIKSGVFIIDQKYAHERILFDRIQDQLSNTQQGTQNALFPTKLALSRKDSVYLKEMMGDLQNLGFDISEFGGDEFLVQGIPSNLGINKNIQEVLEELILQYSSNIDLKLTSTENLARSMAASLCVKRGQELSIEEMNQIVDDLFSSSNPYQNPQGKPCFFTFGLDEIAERFKSR